MTVNHRPRRFGHSKYGVRRFARGFLDLLTVKFLTGFGERPQHILGGFGLVFFALGFLGLFFLGCVWCATNIFGAKFGPIGSRPLLPYSIAAALLGAQALSLGLIAELLVAYTGRETDTFSVRERTVAAAPEPHGVVGGDPKVTVGPNGQAKPRIGRDLFPANSLEFIWRLTNRPEC